MAEWMWVLCLFLSLTGIGCIACQHNAECITDHCGQCNDKFFEFELVQDLEQRIEGSDIL